MDIKELKCIICNKLYVSYKSLWNHNKKFHKTESVSTNQSNQHIDQSNNKSENQSHSSM